jgi:hypothetical protein
VGTPSVSVTIALFTFATLGVSCSQQSGPPPSGETAMTRRSIEQVQNAHTDSLMKLPGVVGTAIGLCGNTPCIKVLVVRATAELRKAIPDSLEGYQVELDETGVIRAQDTIGR